MKLRVLIVIVILFAAFTAAVFAESEDAAQKHGITFPIESLGSCGSIEECKSFCDDPVNKIACIEYAKQKGFYKEPKSSVNDIVNKAKLELGCVSYEACKSLCALAANYEKCASFASKNNLVSQRRANPGDEGVLSRAKEKLGCENVESCRAFCAKDENYDKCTTFAKSVNLSGGQKKLGPGGCTTEASCTAYCTSPDNFNECSKFGKAPSSNTTKTEFKGPGGCTTEESCRDYCMKNPSECYNSKADSILNTQEVMKEYVETQTKTASEPIVYPTKINSMPLDYESLCRQYPDKCAKLTPSPTSTSKLAPTSYKSVSPTSTSTTYINNEDDPGYYYTNSPTPIQASSGSTNTGSEVDVQGASTENPIIRLINFMFFGL